MGICYSVALFGAIVFDSCINYNSMQCRWDGTRNGVRGSLDMQAFPFRWSYAESNQTVKGAGFEWAVDKTIEAVEEIISLLPKNHGTVKTLNTIAQNLPISDKSINAIVTDPPYSDNVMYAEVNDFFYIWLKRLLGDLFPEQFKEEFTNKTEEAVANPIRFADMKRGQAKKLANQDYAAKMEAAFREMHRILQDDGVLCVMFTHRKAEAWKDLRNRL